MLIDCHTHIGRNEHINATTDELLRSMDSASIDRSLVFAGKLNDCPNEYLIKQIAPHRDRLYGVACFHPDDFTYSFVHSLPRLKEQGIVAVKFYLGYDHWYPNNGAIGHILCELEKLGMAAIFHCGDCLNSVKKAKIKYAHPLGIDDVAVDYPKTNMVIAHMGYPWHRDAAEVCYKNDNVSADISGFVYGDFTGEDERKFRKVISEFVDIAGQGALLFGSDWPISSQKSYKDIVIGTNREDGPPFFEGGLWDLIPDMDFLTSGNADRVFKLGLGL